MSHFLIFLAIIVLQLALFPAGNHEDGSGEKEAYVPDCSFGGRSCPKK